MVAAPDDRLLRVALLLAGGGRAIRQLVSRAGGASAARLASAGAPPSLLSTARRIAETEAPTLLDGLAARSWRWLTPLDDDFPSDLAAISDPPLGLFVRGELARRPTVAVVGARRATAYGLQVGRLLAGEVARAGVVVVSGMARGVDRAAHEGALDAGGATWAVWGAGPDRVYPAEHARLAERIAASGALVTEYLPGTPPRRHHFPERNRLIAGLCRAVVVVEAAARSGALATAGQALDEGREVLAVPGSVLSELSVGPNALLRMGARPAVTPRDVLDVLGVTTATGDPPVSPNPAASDRLLAALRPGESLPLDELAGRLGLPIEKVAARMVELEIEGVVTRGPDGAYRRRRANLPRGAE